MATYVLIHGAGSDSWYWHLVGPELQARGHDVVTVDLPCDDDTAGLAEYTDAVVDAIGDRSALVFVAQSMAGFTAPLVCDRVPVDLMVLVAAMVPRPGESPGEWWANTGHAQARGSDASDDPAVMFLHDVPEDVVAESSRICGCSQPRRSRSPGRATRGPRCRRGSCCVATTASSPQSSNDGSCATDSGSCPTRWTAVTFPH
jgi:Alpha/beta hydrolase family